MNHVQHFQRLDAFLRRHRDLWQWRPFAQRQAPWQDQYPDLVEWLEGLPDTNLEELDANPSALMDAIRDRLPSAQEGLELSQVPRLPKQRSLPSNERIAYGVPGRKWSQIIAFTEVKPDWRAPVLEWCAGKGHLGRLAASLTAEPVASLEIDARLCDEGALLASRLKVRQQLHCVDVLQPQAQQFVQAEQQALALHACGALHVQLLQLAYQKRLQALQISPCCYHLISSDFYVPLSQQASASSLRLHRHDLQIAVRETVTASQRTRRQRRTEVSWRLGFDALQRDLRQQDDYLPVPTLRKSMLEGSFQGFCQWAAAQKQLPMPASIDYEKYEYQGQLRYLQVRRMELISHLFRRPMELWLVLDRVLFLEEQGYRVTWGEFCERKLTPRNLVIQAQL